MTNANEIPMPILPKFTRKFPVEIEHLLPLRLSARHYNEDGGIVPTFDESPETDENQRVSGEMYAMTIRPAFLGHAVYVKPDEKSLGFMQVCEPVYEHIAADRMGDAIRIVTDGSLKWVNRFKGLDSKPIRPPNVYIDKTALAYQASTPLCVYTNIAVIEAANYSGDSNFWRTLYAPMELIDCHYGYEGLFYDNNVLSMGSSVGTDDSPAIEMRHPNPNHRGFLGPVFTPQSKGAGRVRMLAPGVSIRVMTRRTVELASRLISAVTHQMGSGFGDWVLRCMGFTTLISYQDVVAVVDEWKTMCEFNMPTLHVFASLKVVVISISSGVLIRPLRTFVKDREFVRQGPFVDSMSVYHSDTMKVANLNFPKHTVEIKQFIETSVQCVPFYMFTTEPRSNLGMQMKLQGMNLFPIKGDATMVSLGQNEPLIATDVMDAILSKNSDENEIVVPGKNTVVAFINRTLNTEDACTVSKEFAEWGGFAWMGYIDYPLPEKTGGLYQPGMVLENENWWKPAMKGLIVKVFVNKSGGRNATVAIYQKELKIGDKLGNWHGVKFTVGETPTLKDAPTIGDIIPFESMPELMDEKTGEKFKPNVLIQTKNLTRGIGGLVREMSATTGLFSSVRGFRTGERPRGKTVFSFEDMLKIEPKLPAAYVLHKGKKIEFTEQNGSTRTVRCNYGIARLMQLRHLPSLKQHYPSTPVRSITVPRGRYREGTPRTGETELISMLMGGQSVHTAENVQAADGVHKDVCSICRAIPYYCDCPLPKPETTQVSVRYATTLLNVYATTAMLNDGKGNPMTMRYHTSVPNTG